MTSKKPSKRNLQPHAVVAVAEDEEKRKRKAVQWAAYEEITRQRAVDAQAKVETDAVRKTLLDEASRWREAQNIREYVAHLVSRQTESLPAGFQSWRLWALQVAEEMDPTSGRIAAFLQSPGSE